MPRNSAGVYSLPPGYLGTTGQTILASQHNPPLEDIASSLTGSLPRNGTAGMLADLPMGGSKVTGMANGVAVTDAATVGQTGALVSTTIAGAAIKTVAVDADSFPLIDSAAGSALKRITWASVKTALNLLYQPLNAVLTALSGIGTAVSGDIIYASGAGVWARRAKGTASQALLMNSGATAPAWATIPFTKSFESAQQMIASGALLTLPHSLSVRPPLYAVFGQCISADAGYASGEEAVFSVFTSTDPAAAKGMSVRANATNILVRFGSDASPIRVIRADNGDEIDIDETKWRLVARAWA